MAAHRSALPRRLGAAVATVAVVGLALVGCSSSDSATTADGLTRITIALPVESGAQILPEIAQEAGFFEEEGITADIKVIEGAQAVIAAMNSGSVQFGNTDIVNALRGTAHGLGIKVLADPIVKPIFDLVAKNEIKTPADLAGKIVGVTQIGNSTDFQVQLALNSVGVDYDSVKKLGLNGYPGIYAGLESGQIDAGTVAVPFNNELIATGRFHQLIDLRGISQAEYPTAVFVTTADYEKAHPDIVQKVANAYVKAVALYDSDPDFVKGVTARFLKLKDPAAATETYDFFKPLFRPHPDVTASQMQVVLPILATAEKKSPDEVKSVVDEAVDSKYVDAAFQKLGGAPVKPVG